MKTIENDSRWPGWFNRFTNWLAVDTTRITSYAEARGPWGLYRARIDREVWQDEHGSPVQIVNPWTTQHEVANPYQSHVWNARSFHRIVYVDWKARGWTWSWRPEGKDYKNTIILGTKLNGRFAITFRFFHSDADSARGTTGANYGQATGDDFGPA